MRCSGCGETRTLASSERVGFRDTCEVCRADLHICRNCRHHDSAAYNECRESSAERVGDRERANRCEFFAPASDDSSPAGAPASDGSAPAGAPGRDQARAALDDLFRKG